MTVRDLRNLSRDLETEVIIYDSDFTRYYSGTIGRIYEEEILKLRVVGFKIDNDAMFINVVKY